MARFLYAKSENRQARTQMMCSLDIRGPGPGPQSWFHRALVTIIVSQCIYASIPTDHNI